MTQLLFLLLLVNVVSSILNTEEKEHDDDVNFVQDSFQTIIIRTTTAPSPATLSWTENDQLGFWKSYNDCYFALILGDMNRNQQLEKSVEYGRFLSRPLEWGFSNLIIDFADIPFPLQRAFYEVATPGMDGSNTLAIDITGVQGQSGYPRRTPEQERNLNYICRVTGQAILQVLVDTPVTMSPSVGIPPQPSLDPTPTTNPSIWTFDQCLRALLISDLTRDDRLNEQEYVRLVNRGGGNIWSGFMFENLPRVLLDNFDRFAQMDNNNNNDDRTIDINGARRGQNTSPEQEAWLRNFCESTGWAIREGSMPTITPIVLPPTPMPFTTAAPTWSPIARPSNVPSAVPSPIPSDVPSNVPSDVPSDVPSAVPSDILSPIPSSTKSSKPSAIPSSDGPNTVSPISSNPTTIPPTSRMPFIAPTVEPTVLGLSNTQPGLCDKPCLVLVVVIVMSSLWMF